MFQKHHRQCGGNILSFLLMKVLMFGWEFPPNISGGLGPACSGIVKILTSQGIEVVFVLPRLFGNESADGVKFLSASDIAFSTNRSTVEIRMKTQEEVSSSEKIETVARQASLPTDFSAYDSPGVKYLVSWWESQKEMLYAVCRYESSGDKVITTTTTSDGTRYPFSGTYKNNLLNETIQYAHVAAAIVKQENFDIIHVHDWITIPAGLTAKRASGKKLVVHVHSTAYDRSKGDPDQVILAIEKEGLEEADAIIAVSAWTKQLLVSRYHIPENKITVAYNGIEQSNGDAIKRTQKFRAPVVTFLGRVTHQKGPLYFIDAAARVLEKFPDTHFVLAGTGDMFEETIMYAARRKVSAQFHFPGFVTGPNLNKLWAMTDVYVMPSVSEPFGLTPLEAIRAGVPTIISNQSGVAEVMPHAIKIDFWNIDAMANAICSILKHKALSSTLANNAKEELREITWEASGQIIEQLYVEALGVSRKTVL